MGGWWIEDEYGKFVWGISDSLILTLIEEARRLGLPHLLRLMEDGTIDAEDMPDLLAECNQSEYARDLLEPLTAVPSDSGVYITNLVDPEDEAE